MQTRAVIDRFEDKTAVCVADSGEVFSLPREVLPEAAKEGDHIYSENDVWHIDEQATQSGKQDLQARMDTLWK